MKTANDMLSQRNTEHELSDELCDLHNLQRIIETGAGEGPHLFVRLTVSATQLGPIGSQGWETNETENEFCWNPLDSTYVYISSQLRQDIAFLHVL
jgi:hypothetical protein